MASSSKPEPHSTKMEHFTSLEAEKKRTNFSRKKVLGEYEVSISDLSDTAFTFIEEIFSKRKWKNLIKGVV
jgi:hypothetical protein